MGDVAAWISGAGSTRFVDASPDTFEAMGQEAVVAAAADAEVDLRDVDLFVCGTGYGGPLAGQRIAAGIGLSGRKIVNTENACSSGSTALELAVQSIANGQARTAVVLGIDKLSALGRGALPLSQDDPEVQQGLIMPGVYSMRAQRYLRETGATESDLAAVAVKARRNGALNPLARQQTAVSTEDVLSSRPVADPLRLFMCCPRADGAAAVVITASPRTTPGVPRVGIRALVLGAGRFTNGFRDMTRSELSERMAAEAYRQASLGPQDMQVAEVHDAFAIAELMYYESLGFAEPGEGWRLIRSGETDIGGRIAVNPGGGLIARGHPVGATGIVQLCEAYWQITGGAGSRQVPDVRNVITHCTGGGIAGFDHGACAVSIVSAA
ncbi:thiolase family protein [Dactylosporangium fulvum]|uniref:propanoyl-CoA C-acyltransferase n=1 Tax=Dactylosporangium fulvum TaxID=53359 RepID=A0ABY5WCE7_9ACTN|nr:thiolase family protein [Dactylosporangium fulvum]UWP86791.1 thiolase family protein [Dactylosporangium fulvum]